MKCGFAPFPTSVQQKYKNTKYIDTTERDTQTSQELQNWPNKVPFENKYKRPRTIKKYLIKNNEKAQNDNVVKIQLIHRETQKSWYFILLCVLTPRVVGWYAG